MPNSLTYFQVTGSWENLDIYHPPSGGPLVAAADVQKVNALVDLIPRIPTGMVFNVSDLVIQAAQNEQQTIDLGGATAGTWTISFNGSAPTAPLASNISTSALQTALQGLSTIGAGNIAVLSQTGTTYLVEFQGTLANTPISTIGAFAADDTGLTNSTGILFYLTQSGQAQISQDTGVHIDPFLARITNGILCTPAAPTDLPGVELVANSALLGFMDTSKTPAVAADLYYDVKFHAVTFGPSGVGLLQNFAFKAPADSTPVDLTDPALTRYPYAPLP